MTNVAGSDPAFAGAGREVDKIPVPVNYDIIRLFSEGLYKSPHKAIEELVSNGYDAGAKRVHVLLPEEPGDATDSLAPLWVIDDGHGMDVDGFHQLWRVAESNKNGPSPRGRDPIGQFGIGKLAAYVLAWQLTHVSRVDGKLLLTSMNFHDVEGRRLAQDGPVACYARNYRLEFTVPWEQHGAPRAWEPDFLVRLRSGTTVVLEIKGAPDADADAKHQAARRWAAAVNNWGRLGRWDFLVCRDPQQLGGQLAARLDAGGRPGPE